MVPPIPTYWDSNNNGIPDPAVGVDADGGNWTQPKLDRLTEATDEWDGDTDWAPFRVFTSGPNKVYIDGYEDPACPRLGAIGRACPHTVNRETQGGVAYKDIEWATITFTPTPSAPFTWWFGSAHTGAEYALDFGGVITHEMGHWVRLQDVSGTGCNYGTGMYTMCGQPQTAETADDDTWRLRGLTTHDISATNGVY